MKTSDERRAYNRAYYQKHREKRLEQVKAYNREFYNKGLRKPRQRIPRSILDHERYLEKRDEILEKQRIYRDTHREEIRKRRRERALQKIRESYERREIQDTTT